MQQALLKSGSDEDLTVFILTLQKLDSWNSFQRAGSDTYSEAGKTFFIIRHWFSCLKGCQILSFGVQIFHAG